jgi:hypothetical protein
MSTLIENARTAKRESKHLEFKEGFDPGSPGEWCEVVKDIVAIANSGGGIIVFGLDSAGTPTEASLDQIRKIDPADISNRVSKYTGPVELEFEIQSIEKQGQKLEAFVIQSAAIPMVFQKPGTYDIGGGKQKTAFGQGSVYFRHGAKSEPGSSNDIRMAIERQLESIRKSWIKGVRKVVKAPAGSQIIAVRSSFPVAPTPSTGSNLRAVNDANTIPVRLTRDRTKATGFLIHEEISDGIFDEINNVVFANRVLAGGQRRFFLGAPIYYRIYAERHHVVQNENDMALLFHSAVSDFYAPAVFWTLTLPPKLIAETIAEVYLHPRNTQVHCLIRLAVILSPELCQWLYERWHDKWKRHPQPPNFYWTFKKMIAKTADFDARLIAARLSQTAQIQISTENLVPVRELLDDPQKASALLSETCMGVFRGDSNLRSVARELDYFAYGQQVRKRGAEITKAILKALGDLEAGDIINEQEES